MNTRYSIAQSTFSFLYLFNHLLISSIVHEQLNNYRSIFIRFAFYLIWMHPFMIDIVWFRLAKQLKCELKSREKLRRKRKKRKRDSYVSWLKKREINDPAFEKKIKVMKSFRSSSTIEFVSFISIICMRNHLNRCFIFTCLGFALYWVFAGSGFL